LLERQSYLRLGCLEAAKLGLIALMLGSWLGTIAFRCLDGHIFRKAVLMMLIVSGLAMLH
jgi:hypothetical protein